MQRNCLLVLLIFSLLIFAGCITEPQPELIQKYVCPTNGAVVENLSLCPPAPPRPVKEVPPSTPEETPEIEVVNESEAGTVEPAQPELPSVPECGNGACAENEDFGTCQEDCAPTYSYLYEYTDALTYSYVTCDRIGTSTNCREETTYVERAEPYFKGNSAKPYYSIYNSYTLRTLNGSVSGQTIKTWVNNTSSECLLSIEQAPLVDVRYNNTPRDKSYACPKIISVEYVGNDSNVEVLLGFFEMAQKFRVTYVADPNAAFPKTETMLIWKVPGPLPDYAGHKFIVHGNIRVPIMTAYEWTYIDDQGIEIHIFSNSTLKTYVEPLEVGG